MKTMIVEYVYYGHPIKQTIHLAHMINQLPPAARMETIIDIFEDLEIEGELEPFQKSIILTKFNKIKDKINHFVADQKPELTV